MRVFIFPNATPPTVPSSAWLISDFFKHFTCLVFTVHACSSIRNTRKLSQQNQWCHVWPPIFLLQKQSILYPQILLLLWSVTLPSSSPLVPGHAILQYFLQVCLLHICPLMQLFYVKNPTNALIYVNTTLFTGYTVTRLRHCAASQKVVGLVGIFHWHNLSGPGVNSASNSTRNIFWGVKVANALPQPPGTLKACPSLYRGCFTFTTLFTLLHCYMFQPSRCHPQEVFIHFVSRVNKIHVQM